MHLYLPTLCDNRRKKPYLFPNMQLHAIFLCMWTTPHVFIGSYKLFLASASRKELFVFFLSFFTSGRKITSTLVYQSIRRASEYTKFVDFNERYKTERHSHVREEVKFLHVCCVKLKERETLRRHVTLGNGNKNVYWSCKRKFVLFCWNKH
jgi:hypothetical protein